MALSMKTMEFQLHESLVQLQEMLTLLNFDREYLDLLEDSKTRIKTRKYHVAVMGEFKRGKSTLLNALLGTPSSRRRHPHHRRRQPHHLRPARRDGSLLPRRLLGRDSFFQPH